MAGQKHWPPMDKAVKARLSTSGRSLVFREIIRTAGLSVVCGILSKKIGVKK